MGIERRKRLLSTAWSWAARQTLLESIDTPPSDAPLEVTIIIWHITVVVCNNEDAVACHIEKYIVGRCRSRS